MQMQLHLTSRRDRVKTFSRICFPLSWSSFLQLDDTQLLSGQMPINFLFADEDGEDGDAPAPMES